MTTPTTTTPQITNFSFQVQLPAGSTTEDNAHDTSVMDTLQTALQSAFAAVDPQAQVLVSRSHRGTSHQLVEITAALQDAQVQSVLGAFTQAHGVVIQALE